MRCMLNEMGSGVLTSIEVRRGRKLVFGVNVKPEMFLEHCARVVARVRGYEYTGWDMLRAVDENPRAAECVAIAREVLKGLVWMSKRRVCGV